MKEFLKETIKVKYVLYIIGIIMFANIFGYFIANIPTWKSNFYYGAQVNKCLNNRNWNTATIKRNKEYPNRLDWIEDYECSYTELDNGYYRVFIK